MTRVINLFHFFLILTFLGRGWKGCSGMGWKMRVSSRVSGFCQQAVGTKKQRNLGIPRNRWVQPGLLDVEDSLSYCEYTECTTVG